MYISTYIYISTQIKKNLSLDELLTTNYFFLLYILYEVALLDFFYDFLFLGFGVNSS